MVFTPGGSRPSSLRGQTAHQPDRRLAPIHDLQILRRYVTITTTPHVSSSPQVVGRARLSASKVFVAAGRCVSECSRFGRRVPRPPCGGIPTSLYPLALFLVIATTQFRRSSLGLLPAAAGGCLTPMIQQRLIMLHLRRASTRPQYVPLVTSLSIAPGAAPFR